MRLDPEFLGDVMTLAVAAAGKSPDPSTQNAAVLVNPWRGVAVKTLSVNRFPDGVQENPDRWERPTKYAYVEHAERNAIYAAARHGIATEKMLLVAVWAACTDCARAIIQAGISTLVRYHATSHAHWHESTKIADEMLAEAGVGVITLDFPLENVGPILRDGVDWHPRGQPSD